MPIVPKNDLAWNMGQAIFSTNTDPVPYRLHLRLRAPIYFISLYTNMVGML